MTVCAIQKLGKMKQMTPMMVESQKSSCRSINTEKMQNNTIVWTANRMAYAWTHLAADSDVGSFDRKRQLQEEYDNHLNKKNTNSTNTHESHSHSLHLRIKGIQRNIQNTLRSHQTENSERERYASTARGTKPRKAKTYQHKKCSDPTKDWCCMLVFVCLDDRGVFQKSCREFLVHFENAKTMIAFWVAINLHVHNGMSVALACCREKQER